MYEISIAVTRRSLPRSLFTPLIARHSRASGEPTRECVVLSIGHCEKHIQLVNLTVLSTQLVSE